MILQAGVNLTSGIILHHVLFILDSRDNFISVGKLLAQNNLISIFTPYPYHFQDPSTNQMKAIVYRLTGLYKSSSVIDTLPNASSVSNQNNSFHASNSVPMLNALHARLGHEHV